MLMSERTHRLHDAAERSSVAAVDESIGDRSAALVMEESGEELRALTHLRLHREDPLKHTGTRSHRRVRELLQDKCTSEKVSGKRTKRLFRIKRRRNKTTCDFFYLPDSAEVTQVEDVVKLCRRR